MRALGLGDDAAALPGRGYRPADWPVTLAMGAASAFGSVIVIVLYLTEEAFPSGAYRSPEFLWAAPLFDRRMDTAYLVARPSRRVGR